MRNSVARAFDELMRDRITLVKQDGTQIEDIKASVQSGKIIVHDETLPFEEGDTLLRKLTNGYTERYTILDTGFHQGLHKIPASFQMKVRKETNVRNDQVGSVIYNLYGAQARVNVQSTDNSINTYNAGATAIFNDLRQQISQNITSEPERDTLLMRVDEMELAHQTGGFLEKYQAFIASAADHITIIAPLIPALTQLLQR